MRYSVVWFLWVESLPVSIKIVHTYYRAFNLAVVLIKFWLYNCRSDWLWNRIIRGYVNTSMTYHCILLALLYKRNRIKLLLVYIAWCKHLTKFGRTQNYSRKSSQTARGLSLYYISLIFINNFSRRKIPSKYVSNHFWIEQILAVINPPKIILNKSIHGAYDFKIVRLPEKSLEVE